MFLQRVAASTAQIVFLGYLTILGSPASAQITGAQVKNPITPVAALPSTCKPYSTYYLTNTKTAYICTATDTLTPLTSGASLADSGCTAADGEIICPAGFSAAGPFSLTGQQQSAALFTNPPALTDALVFDADNAGHLVRKDSGGGLHDLEITRIGGYEIGSENASTAIATPDLTSHSFLINDGAPKTLTEVSCVTDAGSQRVTVKTGTTTLFTITCVAFGSYTAAVTDGTAGYLNAAAMDSTAISAHAQLDLSGTANGATKNLKLHLYGAF